MTILSNPKGQNSLVTTTFGKQVETLFQCYKYAVLGSSVYYLMIVNMAMLNVDLSEDFTNSPEGRLVRCARRILTKVNLIRQQIGPYHV